jgi:hypothetical protein
MIFIIRAALIIAFAMSWASPGTAQVFPVEPIEKGIFSSSDPTLTFLWPGKDSKAVLIMIPGGEGHIGLTPERTDLGGFYGNTLKRLSDPSLTSGALDVVIFDSPYSLPPGDVYPTSRTTSDHLSRIESVVRYYRDKFNKPVWLMGHSNGAVSVTEFWRSRRSLVDGLIVSSARNGIKFPDGTDVPVLFLHHEKDGCQKSTSRSSMAAYETLKAASNKKVEYIFIKGGDEEHKNNCASGYHMYFGAGDEAANAIDRFVSEFYSEAR